MKPPHSPSGDPMEPGTTTETITCETCQQEFQTEKFSVAGRDLYLHRYCEPCRIAAAEKAAANEADAIKRKRMATFEKLAGSYYTGDAIRAAMPMDKAKEIRALVMAGKGVMAHGMSGAFKTTTMLNGAVRWLVMEGHEVAMMTGAEFRHRLSEAAKACRTKAFLRPLKRVPWLFLDDVGHLITDTTGEALHDLVEARVKAGCLPMLLTTQFGGDDFVRQFARPETGLAVGRRIRLLCEKVEFSTTPAKP